MSQDLSITKKAGLLQVGNNVFLNSSGTITNGTGSLTVSSGGIVLPHSNVTQITSSTTSVTVVGSAGIITTFSSTLAGVTSEEFTVSNSSVTADSVVLISAVDYSGTTGIPVLRVNSIVQGGFDIVITNAHATAPLNGTLSISFIIV